MSIGRVKLAVTQTILVCGHFVYAALPPLMGNLVCAVKLAGRIACVTHHSAEDSGLYNTKRDLPRITALD